jgi:hypothetical protein
MLSDADGGPPPEPTFELSAQHTVFHAQSSERVEDAPVRREAVAISGSRRDSGEGSGKFCPKHAVGVVHVKVVEVACHGPATNGLPQWRSSDEISFVTVLFDFLPLLPCSKVLAEN